MQSSLNLLCAEIIAKVQRSRDSEGLGRSHAGEKLFEERNHSVVPNLWGLRNCNTNIRRTCLFFFFSISECESPRDAKDDYSATLWDTFEVLSC